MLKTIIRIIDTARIFSALGLMLCAMPALAWDTPPQIRKHDTHWTSETFDYFTGGAMFNYTDDGTSQVRYSLTPPVEGSTAGTVFKGGWNTLDGKVVIRGNTQNLGGNDFAITTFNVGGNGRENKSGSFSGGVYFWYGKQAMATINWTMHYDPFPIVTIPSGVIDLGTCHKLVSGTVLSKPVSSSITIY